MKTLNTKTIFYLIKAINYNELISKVCKMQNLQKTTFKNDYLQDVVKANKKKKIKIIFDTKTRWNSIIAMIKRFWELKICILDI